MNQDLFPQEIIKNSQEHNFSTHTVRSRIIYSTIVLSLIGIIALLPFIYTDVGVRSRGMLRPVTDVVKIVSPVSAQVTSIEALENSQVLKDAVIAELDDAEIRQKIQLNRSRHKQLAGYLADLATLTDSGVPYSVASGYLRTERYEREAREFEQRIANHQQLIGQQKRLLEREKGLFNRDAISLATLEERQHSYQLEENKLRLIMEQQLGSWNRERVTFLNDIDELEAEYNQLLNELRRYVIRSPITGTLQNMSGILENSFIFANQTIGEISPDTNLVAEVYVTPNEIGLLREGLPVRFQIDAFNHNQWGTATGNIQSISSDMMMNDNTPMFKVRCSIDQTFLELQNGFKGDLKKGMTFQARFIVSRRSLFQLLYDNMDDWLNPSWSSAGSLQSQPDTKNE